MRLVQDHRRRRLVQLPRLDADEAVLDVIDAADAARYANAAASFSVEAPEGVRFLTRSRVFTDEEVDALAAAPR